MGLRNRLPDTLAVYPDPIRGVNYRTSLEDLAPGQAERMKNCFWDGGIRMRYGTTRLTASSLGAFGGRGGIKFYQVDGTSRRFVAYSTRISQISNTGVETILTSALTSDADVHFTPWSILDQCYVANNSNVLGAASSAYLAVTGTNIPASPVMVKPMVDRLLAVQSGYVVWTNARVDTVWSPTTSSWAAIRPVGGAGGVTAIHPHSLTGQQGDPTTQMLVFQSGAVSALTGTDFGTSVIAATASTGFDVAVTLLDPKAGCLSPYGITTVPGIGTFWFTPIGNIAWLPFFEARVRYVGDALFSRRSDISGLNNVNQNALGQVIMVYHDQKLKVAIPLASDTYTTVQYWLDMRPLFEALVSAGRPEGLPIAWNGPHEGQSIRRWWAEDQAGDNDRLYALEGNSARGFYVYRLDDNTVYNDKQGVSQANVIYDYQTFYHDFGAPGYEKYISRYSVDAVGRLAAASVGIYDLHGDTISNLSITQMAGTVYTYRTWGDSTKWGVNTKWGVSLVGHRHGLIDVNNQAASAAIGDRMALRVYQANGPFVINQILPQVQVRRSQPFS